MFKLPEDLYEQLELMYPDSNIDLKSVVNNIFTLILNKTIEDSSCNIREFGKFIAFTALSTRVKRKVVRFKFKISQSLYTKLQEDEYILNNLPFRDNNEFNETNEKNCEAGQEIRERSTETMKYAEQLGRQRTYEKLAKKAIESMISE